MNSRASIIWTLLAGLVVCTTASAVVVEHPDIVRYGTGKIRGFQQTSAGSATAQSYSFVTFIDGRDGGTINAARIQGPYGFLSDSGAGAQPLTRYGNYWEYRSTSFLTGGDLNEQFPDIGSDDPNGNYRLRIDTGAQGGWDYTVGLKLDGGTIGFPTATPTITSSNGEWMGGRLVFDAGHATFFGFNVGGYNPATDFIIFSVVDSSGNIVVRAFYSQVAELPTGYGFGANALAIGDYTGSLTFGRIHATTSAIPGAQGISFYSLETNFSFTAVPEPSTYLLLAMGLGFVALIVRRRR